jgi:hypothetical protein
MDEVWNVTPAETRGMHDVTLRVGPPRPLTAQLSDSELAKLQGVLPATAEMVRRGQFSRVQLGAAFHEAIGRDPFRQVGAPGKARRTGRWPWWADLAFVVVALGFAADDHALVLRIGALVFAAVAFADFIGHVVRPWRRTSLRNQSGGGLTG